VRLYLNIAVPVSGPIGLEAALECLVALNRIYLRTHPRTPHIYKAGVRYLRDADEGTQETPPAELWLTIPDCISAGGADCKVLSAWMVADLRERGGEAGARCVLSRKGHLWHVRVQRANGTIEDPSRALGMGGEA
jgi:hypothetical protein